VAQTVWRDAPVDVARLKKENTRAEWSATVFAYAHRARFQYRDPARLVQRTILPEQVLRPVFTAE